MSAVSHCICCEFVFYIQAYDFWTVHNAERSNAPLGVYGKVSLIYYAFEYINQIRIEFWPFTVNISCNGDISSIVKILSLP